VRCTRLIAMVTLSRMSRTSAPCGVRMLSVLVIGLALRLLPVHLFQDPKHKVVRAHVRATRQLQDTAVAEPRHQPKHAQGHPQ